MNNWTISKIAAAGAAALALVLAGCGGAGTFTANGNDQVCVDATDITDGTQVIVTDSSGKVIGTGQLAEDNSAAAMKLVTAYDKLQVSLSSMLPDSGSSSGMSIYKFTVPGLPAGEQRYGISIGQDRGTVWFSAQQMQKGPGLTLGC